MSPPLKSPFWADIRLTLFGGMDRTGKLLGLLPFAISLFASDKTLEGFFVVLVFGSILWIPYWVLWLLSDGFMPTTISETAGRWERFWHTAFGRMKRTRKLSALVPYIIMLGIAPGTVEGVLIAIFGGTVVFFPYLLAWFLSDGFENVRIGAPIGASPFGSGFRDTGQDGYGSGGQGAGLYVNGTRVD